MKATHGPILQAVIPKDEFLVHLGGLARESRKTAGLTLKGLAEKMGGISPSFISEFEQGKRTIAPYTLYRLEAALGGKRIWP